MTTDLRLAARTLLKARGFTLATILSLALGMTLCTMTLSVVNAYLFTNLPLVALTGIYGVVAYAVRQREREIAVRLAVGADGQASCVSSCARDR